LDASYKKYLDVDVMKY